MTHPIVFHLCPVDETDLPALLEVYRGCEDFLALGPHPQASPEMVRADLELSRSSGSQFHGIRDESGRLIGVADWMAGGFEGQADTADIELLMIARPYRRQGLGRAIVAEIEKRIRQEGRAAQIASGVQVNNRAAMRFWLRCGFRSAGPPQKQADGTTSIPLLKDLHGSN